jgi:hypothetical protein
MIGNNRKKQKKVDDNINQVILFIKHLIAKNRVKKIDVFQLCSKLREIGLTISVSMAPSLPLNVSSLWFELKGQYAILYRGASSSVFTQLHILHELSHILLGHSPFTLDDLASGRSIYTHSEEMEAELVASKIFLLLNPIEYDSGVLGQKYPSAIVKQNNEHLFREVMDVKPSVMTTKEKKISQQMSEFFSL